MEKTKLIDRIVEVIEGEDVKTLEDYIKLITHYDGIKAGVNSSEVTFDVVINK